MSSREATQVLFKDKMVEPAQITLHTRRPALLTLHSGRLGV
jgi:hypothetical protein